MIYMRKILYIVFFCLLATIQVVAQEKKGLTPEKRKEFREYKMKFLAQEMELKDDNRKRFFELYDELSNERFELRSEMHTINAKIKENKATEADYTRLNKLKEQEGDLEKKYDAKFASFLSSKEIFKMKEAENVFRKKLHDMKSKKGKRK